MVLQSWPLAIFLLCPLMYLFKHGGHGADGETKTRRQLFLAGKIMHETAN
ncbi:MAG: DUF2933 domain-containing protein [Oligoflexus sp.]